MASSSAHSCRVCRSISASDANFFPDREETTLTALFAAVQQVQVESGWVEAVRCCSECTQGTSGPLIQPTEHTHSINLTRRLHLSTRADLNPSKCSESYTSGGV